MDKRKFLICMKLLIMLFFATIMNFIPLTITLNTSVPKFTAKFDENLLFLDLLYDLKFTEEKI
jgi:hypothetical protein